MTTRTRELTSEQNAAIARLCLTHDGATLAQMAYEANIAGSRDADLIAHAAGLAHRRQNLPPIGDPFARIPVGA